MAEKPNDQSEDIGAKRTLEVESLMSDSRVNPRRIKVQKTSDGDICGGLSARTGTTKCFSFVLCFVQWHASGETVYREF